MLTSCTMIHNNLCRVCVPTMRTLSPSDVRCSFVRLLKNCCLSCCCPVAMTHKHYYHYTMLHSRMYGLVVIILYYHWEGGEKTREAHAHMRLVSTRHNWSIHLLALQTHSHHHQPATTVIGRYNCPKMIRSSSNTCVCVFRERRQQLLLNLRVRVQRTLIERDVSTNDKRCVCVLCGCVVWL